MDGLGRTDAASTAVNRASRPPTQALLDMRARPVTPDGVAGAAV